MATPSDVQRCRARVLRGRAWGSGGADGSTDAGARQPSPPDRNARVGEAAADGKPTRPDQGERVSRKSAAAAAVAAVPKGAQDITNWHMIVGKSGADKCRQAATPPQGQARPEARARQERMLRGAQAVAAGAQGRPGEAQELLKQKRRAEVEQVFVLVAMLAG